VFLTLLLLSSLIIILLMPNGFKSTLIDHIIYNKAVVHHIPLSPSCFSFIGISYHKPIIFSCNKELSISFMKPKISFIQSKHICNTKYTNNSLT